MTTCAHCGEGNREGARFCNSCGAAIRGPDAPPAGLEGQLDTGPPRQPVPYGQPWYGPPRPPLYPPPAQQSKTWLWVLLAAAGGLMVMLLMAAIAVPVFFSARESAKEGECRDNLRTIDAAVLCYSADNNGEYPSSVGELVPMYLKEEPECPDGGRYTFEFDEYGFPQAVCPNGHAY